jgi:uncharacterized phiE125 gp8 family phage protein
MTCYASWPSSWWAASSGSSPAWDAGVRWHLEQVVAPTTYPLDLDFVRDQHLRGANGTAEDDYIDRLIRVTTRTAERYMRRPLMPQTWAMVLDRFPVGLIEVPLPTLLSVESIAYIDSAGVDQTLSAAVYQVGTPYGTTRGTIALISGQLWPSVQASTTNAVTVTFRAGFAQIGSPEVAEVPEDITQGMLLVIGELYKQRSESVIGSSVQSAVLRAQRDFWHPYRVY